MELPAATQKPDKAHALLFALELLFELLFMELLFIIRPHGAVEFLKMRCCWCALLVICWLSARLCPGIMIADMYWQFCTEWQDRLITVDMYWQFCAEWQDRLITADMYWQFCAEWQDRPGIITLEIMRAR